MANKGRPKTHAHAGHGVDTFKNPSIPSMKLTPEQIESLKQFNKELHYELGPVIVPSYFDNELHNNKLSKDLSYAIIALLLSNSTKLKNARDSVRVELYRLLKMLDISDKAFKYLLKTFKLERIYNNDKMLQQLINSPTFNKFYQQISHYINTELLKHSTNRGTLCFYLLVGKASNSTLPLLTSYDYSLKDLINYYQQLERAFQIYKKEGLFEALKNGDFEKLYSGNYDFNVWPFIRFDEIFSPFFVKVMEYYIDKPLDEIPPVIIFLLSTINGKVIFKVPSDKGKDKYYFSSQYQKLKNKTMLKSPLFQNYIREVIRDLDSSNSFFELMLKIALNEARFLSQPLTKDEIAEMKRRISKIGPKNGIYIKEPYEKHPELFKHKIDYFMVLYPMRNDQTMSFRELIEEINRLKREGIEISSNKDLFTIKWLNYYPKD